MGHCLKQPDLDLILQKYSDAIELNAYDAEFYLKRAAAFMKITNYQGNQWTQFFNGMKYFECNKLIIEI